jgi:G6PDH family F420-dependent oxidoreductase
MKKKFANIKISVNLGEGYHNPKRFVECTLIAEEYGFDTVWFGDHTVPWIHKHNKSAFVWSVMSSALEASKKIKAGVLVTTPIGGRYHPLIIGQAAATLDNMYPGRFSLGVGSGEAINENYFFQSGMPNWQERIDRLAEAVILIKKMWINKEYFSYNGKYFKIKNFFLYTKPKKNIPIYFAAQGKKAAKYAGLYGDHLVTINSADKCQNKIFLTFEKVAQENKKNPRKMEKMVEILLYFSEKEKGIAQIKRNGEAGFLVKRAFNETDPRKIQKMSMEIGDKRISNNFCFVEKPEDIINKIKEYQLAGATHVELVTHSYPDKIRYIGEKVLPTFR